LVKAGRGAPAALTISSSRSTMPARHSVWADALMPIAMGYHAGGVPQSIPAHCLRAFRYRKTPRRTIRVPERPESGT
jgi:hypothetical protein